MQGGFGKIRIRLAGNGAPVVVKRRAVNRQTKLKKNSLYIIVTLIFLPPIRKRTK
jgi:hypothetical protein